MKITRILAFVQSICLSTSLLLSFKSTPSVFNRLEFIIVKRSSLRQPQHEKDRKDPQNPSLRRTVSPVTDLGLTWLQDPLPLPPFEQQGSTWTGWNSPLSSPLTYGSSIGINRKKTHKIWVSAGLYLRLQTSISSGSKRQLPLLCVNDKPISLD